MQAREFSTGGVVLNRWYWLYVSISFALMLVFLVGYVATLNTGFFVALAVPSLVLLELSDFRRPRRR